MLWNERSARLKLVLPCQGEMQYDVPGGKVARKAVGQVPGGRWALRSAAGGTVGFASDVLGDFDATAEELRVTLARASRYASDVMTPPDVKVWQPAVDCGELKFQFSLFGEDAEADRVADALLFSPAATVAPPTAGPWGRTGSLGALKPETMRLLSMEQCEGGALKVRVQNRAREAATAVLSLGESTFRLGELGPEQIETYLVHQRGKGRGGNGEQAGEAGTDGVRARQLEAVAAS
jgi:alpha-mannosidase